MTCDCLTCWYCQRLLIGPHEHDHMPLPARHNGQHVVAACIDCHNAKDRTPLHDWPEEAIRAAITGCATPEARIMLAKMYALALDAQSAQDEPRIDSITSAGRTACA